MDDPILMSRLEALKQNLDVVGETLGAKAWKPEQVTEDTRAELLEDQLWSGLETELVKPILVQLSKLEDVKNAVVKAAPNDNAALSAAWTRYGTILRASQSLLRECLEIIGTLAIRNKDLDERILHIADELVRECLGNTTGDPHYYLLVHGLADTFSKTKARIIRLRFPEWNIWDLPLAPHELGHVVVANTLSKELELDDEEKMLTHFLKKWRDALLGQDTELNLKFQQGGVHAVEAQELADARVRVLLADAFATYTMGPAYACSAIMLRFSPIVDVQGDRTLYTQRAHVVLSMLGWMNNQADIIPPYRQIIDWLKDDWQRTVNLFPLSSTLNTNEEAYLKQLAEEFAKILPFYLRNSALYPLKKSQTDGWGRAEEWAEGWFNQRDDKDGLTLPTNRTGKLRDVLNAGWLCRMTITKDEKIELKDKNVLVSRVARAAQDLCMAIIAARPASTPYATITTSQPSGAAQ